MLIKLKRLKLKYWVPGELSGKLLAYCLKQMRQQHIKFKMFTSGGLKITNTECINYFSQWNEQLYKIDITMHLFNHIDLCVIIN